jgi:hypothetical protein
MTRKQCIEVIMRIGNPISRVPMKGKPVRDVMLEPIFSAHAAGQLVDALAAMGSLRLDPEPMVKR